MTSFLLSILAGTIVAIAYGWLFAQREEKIRGALSAKRTAWARRRYVKAFVGSVRGHAGVIDTLILGLIILTVPFVAAVTMHLGASYLESRLEVNDIRLSSVEAKLHQEEAITKESLEADVRKLRAEVDSQKASGGRTILMMDLFSAVMLGVVFYGLLLWLPFAVMRKQFEREIDRFNLRIQGLASKAELAELALAESSVSDEESLRSFVQIAAAIAKRQGVPRLVERFDLWANPNET